MRRTRFRARIVLLLIAVAVSLGAGQGMLAQTNGQRNVEFKGSGIQGKMRSTTNAERWKAAARNADHRAKKIKKDKEKGKGK